MTPVEHLTVFMPDVTVSCQVSRYHIWMFGFLALISGLTIILIWLIKPQILNFAKRLLHFTLLIFISSVELNVLNGLIYNILPLAVVADAGGGVRDSLTLPSGVTTGLLSLAGAVAAWLQGGLQCEVQWLDFFFAYRTSSFSYPMFPDTGAGISITTCVPAFTKFVNYTDQAGYIGEANRYGYLARIDSCGHSCGVIMSIDMLGGHWQQLLRELFILPPLNLVDNQQRGEIVLSAQHMLCCMPIRDVIQRCQLPGHELWVKSNLSIAQYFRWLRIFATKEFVFEGGSLSPESEFARAWCGDRNNHRWTWADRLFFVDYGQDCFEWDLIENFDSQHSNTTSSKHSTQHELDIPSVSRTEIEECKRVTIEQVGVISAINERLEPRWNAIETITSGGIIMVMVQERVADSLMSDMGNTFFTVQDTQAIALRIRVMDEKPYIIERLYGYWSRLGIAAVEVILTAVMVAFTDPGMLISSYAARNILSPFIQGPSKRSEYLGWMFAEVSISSYSRLDDRNVSRRLFSLKKPVSPRRIWALGILALLSWVLSFVALAFRPKTAQLGFNTNSNIPNFSQRSIVFEVCFGISNPLRGAGD
ncbi:hypothetical protein NEOLI_001203 [Neolecta irregularis DAH-3]|uniref:Uncharacterized protein n=1 Tax=Neolecta irregularis (strain DAH-3) TaxID=1198029 RepID=A0A1U7LUI0_NEOID|nr:hypothetical protein NEOLI_001203 [Neolecta irregularis DAH-3]|eukprot:OLL26171.1 hypothetical protein NEOLI_001203 [Neolecta irregularis DAH-3]